MRLAVPAMLAALLAFSMPTGSVAKERETRTVLMIQFGLVDGPNNSAVRNAFQQELRTRSSFQLEIFPEFLRSDRLSEADASDALRQYIRGKYQNRRIDAVIADNTPNARFAIRNRDELFPGVPIVFGSIEAPDEAVRKAGAGATGLLFGNGYRETVELAARLHPAAQRVFVIAKVADRGVTEQFQNLLLNHLRDLPRGLKVEFVAPPTVSRLVAKLKDLPADAFVLFVEYVQDGDEGAPLTNWPEHLVAEVAKVPVYGITERHLGSGVVGGMIRTSQALGTRLAAITADILDGRPAAAIPVERLALSPTFDWRQLQRWQIEALALPARSNILFRTPTAWELYRWYVVVAIGVVGFQSLLITGLLLQRTRRQRAENDVRAKESALRRSYDEVRQLAGRLINAQEEERTRIARELHDDVGQRVASLSIGLSRIKRHLLDHDEPVRQELSELQRQTIGLAGDVRSLSHELHPGTLEHVGFAEALRSRCDELNADGKLDLRLDVAYGWSDPPPDVTLCLYRVAQEALRNIVKHAHATTTRISLAREDGVVTMLIRDDGTGFDPDGAATQRGLGLISMRERVGALGGSFAIGTARDEGVAVTVRIPVGAVQ